VGYRVGNAMIYTYNIAFIVNLGKANGTDVMKVVNHIEKIMKKKYGIEMRREVVTIGSFFFFN
jgi:UDP-N-acetylmuramate dehydrogenase